MMRMLLLAVFMAFALPAGAVIHPDEKLRDPALEARAIHLTKQLRCVVCQNESLEESAADMARDLRLLVRRQIMEGKSDEEILAFLRQRYGDFIMLEPPLAPRTWLLWLTPAIVLGAGLLFVWPSLRVRRRK